MSEWVTANRNLLTPLPHNLYTGFSFHETILYKGVSTLIWYEQV